MEKAANSVQGKCMGMCPKEEIIWREKEKLLHILEMVSGTENQKRPKASEPHMVKSFSRSAAGKQIKVETLRPPKVLLKTVNYLLCQVTTTKKVPWNVVYDFITDRLMAVRQDMVVQNISKAESITILQPIIRFHALAAYKLCEHSVANFDPTLNNNHLQECLKRLLNFYEGYDDRLKLDIKAMYDDYLKKQPEFEALYVIFNLGSDEALRRTVEIPEQCKTTVVKNAQQVSLCFKYGNFVRLCRLIRNLPTLLAAVASLHLPEIRRRAFRTMSTAYHSKNLWFPLKLLKDILLYGTEDQLVQDCIYYGIKVDNKCIYFTKQNFDIEKKVLTPRHESFMDEKMLETNIHSLILGM